MGWTITEKILGNHVGKEGVKAGEHIFAEIDLMLANDITFPLSLNLLKELESKVDFKGIQRLTLIADHFTPNKDVRSAENVKLMREFSKKYGVQFYHGGRCGVEHCLLPEEGLVVPGDLIIGADSHTCTYGALGAFSTGVGSTDLAAGIITGKVWLRVPETIKIEYRGKPGKWVYGKDIILMTLKELGEETGIYKALEFTGETISYLDMPQRFTICNMAVEGGAKNGIIQPDKITEDYVSKRAKRNYRIYYSDPDAEYAEIRTYDISHLTPQVAIPHSPLNSVSIFDLPKIEIDQVFIGSCTNGWYEDLLIAANILKGKKVNENVRLIVAPATYKIYLQALKSGILEIFASAGAIISPPTCGPCLGGHMGVLASGEKAVSTTNRNFIGRMGHPQSEVYLANPAVAAASAVLGRIAHPDEVK
jgi:3-isopropylmalate/(R)-2-methylmalate dehydratase large subunit